MVEERAQPRHFPWNKSQCQASYRPNHPLEEGQWIAKRLWIRHPDTWTTQVSREWRRVAVQAIILSADRWQGIIIVDISKRCMVSIFCSNRLRKGCFSLLIVRWWHLYLNRSLWNKQRKIIWDLCWMIRWDCLMICLVMVGNNLTLSQLQVSEVVLKSLRIYRKCLKRGVLRRETLLGRSLLLEFNLKKLWKMPSLQRLQVMSR